MIIFRFSIDNVPPPCLQRPGQTISTILPLVHLCTGIFILEKTCMGDSSFWQASLFHMSWVPLALLWCGARMITAVMCDVCTCVGPKGQKEALQ